MGSHPKDGQISTLRVDESFAAQDDQFVEQVRRVTSPKYLAALADRWKQDPRPWARQQILNYLAFPFDRPGHHPLVKRLFKQAEQNGDSLLMAAFTAAFDRLIRRQRRMTYQWDRQSQRSWQEEELFAPRDQILASANPREHWNPRTGERTFVSSTPQVPKHGRLFSYRTRRYLQRRAWRYFRRLGYQRPAEYPEAVAAVLAHYRDEDVAKGENILDCWSLTHIAFRRSPVLLFKRLTIEVVDGRSLGELVAAPQFDDLWMLPESAAVLLKLVTEAQSRLVCVWAMQLLKRDHATSLQSVTAEQLMALLSHPDEEVQHFGAGLLESLAGIDHWTIAAWLQLLETCSVTALATICEAMSRRISPARLTLEQCVSLACMRSTPVARLGLTWLSGRAVTSQQDRAAIARLADVQCEAIGAEAAKYALAILGSPSTYRTDDISPFFDSRNAEVRQGAWVWLTPQSPGYTDPALWSRLLETPYDDVRLQLVAELTQRTRATKVPAALKHQDLANVWTTVLLGVHRGGRAKLSALRQISQAIADHPDRAERLIPVLAVAIRSVRPAEARAGLSAILSAIATRPELEASLARHLPELRLHPEATAS